MPRRIYEGTVVIPLLKPIKYEDKTITEVKLDFSKASAATVMHAERETFSSGNVSTVIRNMSSEFNAHIAASISGIKFRIFEKFHPADFDTIWQTAAAFMSNNDPEEFYRQYTGIGETDDDDENVIEGEGFFIPTDTPEDPSATKN